MIKVLHRGLKFAIVPLKLDISQLLTDFKSFERTMVWQEYWYGKDSDPYIPPIFKPKKRVEGSSYRRAMYSSVF